MKNSTEKNRIIYLCATDHALAQGLVLDFASANYTLQLIDDPTKLEQICQAFNTWTILVNIQFLDNRLTDILSKIKTDYPSIAMNLFFIAENYEITLHLKAVQAGGQAYYVMPFQAEEIIARLLELSALKNKLSRVLIIDGNKKFAKYYVDILKNAGMIAEYMSNPLQMDKILHEFNPNLVLMDIDTPTYNGLDLAAVVRQRNAYASLPIIFISAKNDTSLQLEALNHGIDDYLMKSITPEHLISSIKNRIARYEIMQSYIIRDSLTGLFNHNAIKEKLKSEIVLSKRLGLPLSIAIVDIDFFKTVNDSYGHLMGDKILRSLSITMLKRLRKTDIIGRYGGEEFLVILPNTTTSAAKNIIDQLRQQFAAINYQQDDRNFNVTLSAGVVTAPPYLSVEKLFQAADEAMYRAKKNGRNQVVATGSVKK